ncbi:hypothetical protein VP01_2628g5 [Puccinia sorghi]|uniref:Uncharacterized protein n=1 Tax=Puccinia sorghi TaxID=27349 RepID=A0A0L6V4C5_9BASI|nr:hypothetical protein VP01_2628g5 [Puccinia sorghi]
MSLQNHSQVFIQRSLFTVSCKYFTQWSRLYEETQHVVRDPEENKNSWLNLCATSQLFSWTKSVSAFTIMVALFSESKASTWRPSIASLLKWLICKPNFWSSLVHSTCLSFVFNILAGIVAEFLLVKAQDPCGPILTKANSAQYSIIRGISYFGVFTVTVKEATEKSCHFEHFLKVEVKGPASRGC